MPFPQPCLALPHHACSAMPVCGSVFIYAAVLLPVSLPCLCPFQCLYIYILLLNYMSTTLFQIICICIIILLFVFVVAMSPLTPLPLLTNPNSLHVCAVSILYIRLSLSLCCVCILLLPVGLWEMTWRVMVFGGALCPVCVCRQWVVVEWWWRPSINYYYIIIVLVSGWFSMCVLCGEWDICGSGQWEAGWETWADRHCELRNKQNMYCIIPCSPLFDTSNFPSCNNLVNNTLPIIEAVAGCCSVINHSSSLFYFLIRCLWCDWVLPNAWTIIINDMCLPVRCAPNYVCSYIIQCYTWCSEFLRAEKGRLLPASGIMVVPSSCFDLPSCLCLQALWLCQLPDHVVARRAGVGWVGLFCLPLLCLTGTGEQATLKSTHFLLFWVDGPSVVWPCFFLPTPTHPVDIMVTMLLLFFFWWMSYY